MTAAIDAFGYAGKRVFVVGGASGIGAATAGLVRDLGAEVIVADYADVPFECAKQIAVDLRGPDSIEAAVDACGGPIDALFSCAGISTGTDVLRVNFVGQRDLIERCVDGGLMPRGSAIGMIASGAGLGWERNREAAFELIDTPDWATADAWVGAHPDLNHYAFSKEVVIAYCARRAFPLLQHG